MNAQRPRLRVSDDRRYLVTENGKPFFCLADTAWEIFHRLKREQVAQCLEKRKEQGFTIQAVAIVEFDGLTKPNAYGALPLVGRDPAKPDVAGGYWGNVDSVVEQANRRGLCVGLLPTWGRYVSKAYFDDEQIFTPENAETYGEFLGKRYGNRGVIWILGGDRTGDGVQNVWRAMAKGIRAGGGGEQLMSFHPRGGATSAEQMRWLRALMESRPGGRVPDQGLVDEHPEGADYIAATRRDGYLFVYSAQGRRFTLRLGRISGRRVRATWFNSRSGEVQDGWQYENAGTKSFHPPLGGVWKRLGVGDC